MANGQPATGDFPDLQTLTADIHSDISALSQGLARAGAPAPVIQRLAQAAGMFQELHQVLSQEQAIPNPAHNPNAAGGPQPGAAQPQQAQPQQAAQPQQGGPGNAHPALVSAVQSLAKALPNPQQQ